MSPVYECVRQQWMRKFRTTDLRVAVCCRLSWRQKMEEVGREMFSWDGNRLRRGVLENSRFFSVSASSSRLCARPHFSSDFSRGVRIGIELVSCTHFPYLVLISWRLRHSRHSHSTCIANIAINSNSTTKPFEILKQAFLNIFHIYAYHHTILKTSCIYIFLFII